MYQLMPLEVTQVISTICTHPTRVPFVPCMFTLMCHLTTTVDICADEFFISTFKTFVINLYCPVLPRFCGDIQFTNFFAICRLLWFHCLVTSPNIFFVGLINLCLVSWLWVEQPPRCLVLWAVVEGFVGQIGSRHYCIMVLFRMFDEVVYIGEAHITLGTSVYVCKINKHTESITKAIQIPHCLQQIQICNHYFKATCVKA